MLFFHLLLTVFLIGIFFYDLTRYRIPNWMTIMLLLLYPAMLVTLPALPEGLVVWQSLMVALAVFALGVVIFALRITGGGDVKLLTALSLWTGVACTAEFLIYMAMLGGVLALGLLLIRPVAGRLMPMEKAASLPRVLRHGEPVPYGLAITVSFLFLLWTGEIPGLPVSW